MTGPPPQTPSRLGVIDEIFLLTHRGFGTPIALQGLWRTDEPLPSDVLADVHARLSHGTLGRRVVTSAVPGARPRWVAAQAAHPLELVDTPVAADDISDFAQRNLPDLNPETGPGWHVRAAPLRGGGTLAVLTCSHVLCDARGLIDAVDRVLAGKPEPVLAEPDSNWRDARRTWRRITTGTTLRASGHENEPVPAARPKTAPARTAIITCPAAQWDTAANVRDGTPNSLFVAVVVNVLASATGSAEPVSVGLPIDTRESESGGNSITMGAATIAPRETLAVVRERCRTAYDRPLGNPPGRPAEWLHVLPNRIAHAASRGAGEREVLCSNIGTLPDSVAQLGSHRASGL
uniref:hypothetical protein n=1 Tax=Aldersonia kunmingensis TaxID=408066 RepID=UPI0008319A4F